jgi:hypothetical protein
MGAPSKKYLFINKEFLEREYVETGLTDTELASKLKCLSGTIKYKRQQFDISQNTKKQGKNLAGQKFGKLLVIKEHLRKNKRIFWFCKCKCGNDKIVSGHDLATGNTGSCGCSHWTSGSDHYLWNGYKDITGQMWSHLQQRAQKRGIDWQITKQEAWDILENQYFKCKLSNLPINVGENASVDRIDSSLEYTLDNIQWVHKDVNVMKWEYPLDYFVHLCKLVINNSNEEGYVEVTEKRGVAWRGFGNISGDFWRSIKDNAKTRSLSFDLSIEEAWNLFLSQKGKCGISGLPIRFSKLGEDRYAKTASIDRKNSSVGYKLDNVWWVHKDINNIKWKLNFNYFLELCSAITKTQQEIICG